MRLTRHPGLVALACIALFVAGGGTALFGIMAMSYDEPLATVAGFIAAGAAIMAASIALTAATERRLRRDEAAQKALAAASSATPAKRPKRERAPAARPDAVVAEWTIEPYEWRAYYQGEATERRLGAPYNAVLGAIPGAMVAWLITGEWRYTAAGAALLGLAALVLTLVSAARLQRREPSGGGAVVVRRNAVEIDGTATVLSDGTWWLSGAKVRDDLPLPVIELSVKKTTYERGGSRRTLERVVRVPLPRGRDADARRIADELARGTAGDEGDD